VRYRRRVVRSGWPAARHIGMGPQLDRRRQTRALRELDGLPRRCSIRDRAREARVASGHRHVVGPALLSGQVVAPPMVRALSGRGLRRRRGCGPPQTGARRLLAGGSMARRLASSLFGVRRLGRRHRGGAARPRCPHRGRRSRRTRDTRDPLLLFELPGSLRRMKARGATSFRKKRQAGRCRANRRIRATAPAALRA